MGKKIYLSIGEQKLWGYIKDKEIVNNELIKDIFPDMSSNKRNKLLHNLYDKGYLRRVRKDLYYNPENLRDYYSLALKIREGYLGLTSALKYYNLMEYEDFTIFIITKNFQKSIILKGTKYDIQFVPLKDFFRDFEKKDNIYVSSVEKTILDCFIKTRFVSFSIITKAIYDANIDWGKFISLLKTTKNNSLHQRIGYILDLMREKTKFKIPRFVFEYLVRYVKSPSKLTPTLGHSSFNKKWKIQDNIGEKNILSWWY